LGRTKKKYAMRTGKDGGMQNDSISYHTGGDLSSAPQYSLAPGAVALLPSGSPRGLLAHECITVPGNASVDVHMLNFDRIDAVPDAFNQVGLHMPASIARSVKSRQREFLFGRIAARAALSRFGHGNFPVMVGPNREPLWPPGFIGSITHCAQHAAACALPCVDLHGIGIDLEAAIALETREAVEKLVLLPAERERLRAIRTLPPGLLLAAAFSAKESFYKAVSAAAEEYVDFGALRIDDIDASNGRIVFTLEQTICPAWKRGSRDEINLLLLDDDRVLTCFLW
jgi:4'-phosphopantetheinyl transferase EntD